VGITGNSGCGQTSAAGIIAGRCRGICSLDRIGHRLLSKPYVLRELAAGFSRDDFAALTVEELRSELGNTVFNDDKKMTVLNSVLHPRMIGWASSTAARLSGIAGIRILEGALLIELGIDRFLDCMIVIEDTFERCAERLYIRDNVTTEQARRRWRQQYPLREKVLKADYVVDNSKDLVYMKQQILTIFEELESRSLT